MQMSMAIAAIFATICFGVAAKGFLSMESITDPTVLADARGFAWFWIFLGGIATLFGLLGAWLIRTQKDE
jgi:ABC-type branched-subunit amino acid transport system permease subunit